jgi:hypothetical protein
VKAAAFFCKVNDYFRPISQLNHNDCALKLKTTMPKVTIPKLESRNRLADSPNKTIPSKAVKTVPLPAHTA